MNMAGKWLFSLLASALFMVSCSSSAQELTLISNKTSGYKIVVPAEATAMEQKAANVLQKYFRLSAGVELPIVKEDAVIGNFGLYLGKTGKGKKLHPGKLANEAYLLEASGSDIFFMGGGGRGLLFSVYAFLENYAGCQKVANVTAFTTTIKDLKIPLLHEEITPQFEYRESYYPASLDAEYQEWNRLQDFEDLWGPKMWGHTYDKLVPGKTYFKEHPEYFALVKGRRQPSQLCLANEEVYNIVVAELKKRIAASPDALYWSVSPNDDIGYCECDLCKKTDNEQGGPQGSLIKFVNRVAANFPDKKITTLAYGYTHKPTKSMKPAANVYIFLSDIDAYRDKPLTEEGSAAAFRADLKGWGALTPNIFVWDYVTQFTNYLAPFPNFHTLQANMKYMKENGVKGVFVQGSGETYSEFAELRCYVIAKLLSDANADVRKLESQFITDYYGPKAGKFIQQYLDLLQAKMLESHRKLDIYGNPVNEWGSWLSPGAIDAYSEILDKAEAAAEGNATFQDRVMKVRLAQEYTVFQQARFYGIERFGIFVKENAGGWQIKPKLQEKIKRFVANCKKAGVTELSEGGPSPDRYQAEWDAIFKAGVTPTKAIGASVALKFPFVEDYPAKGTRTLVDGNPGYNDFSYNWLCFNGVPMVATIDLGVAQSVKNIKMHFLDDPRHWIFLPESIKIEVSEDGSKYRSIGDIASAAKDEHFELTIKEFQTQNKTSGAVRYIRITAANLPSLPEWRYREGKKPMLACDEVFVE